jgi:transposase
LEEWLVKRYPTGCVVLIMDNASYHKRAFALVALSLFEHRVMVIWLPPNCSDLNPIERFWRHLNDVTCANKLESNIEGVQAAVLKILNEQNNPASTLRFHVSKNL